MLSLELWRAFKEAGIGGTYLVLHQDGGRYVVGTFWIYSYGYISWALPEVLFLHWHVFICSYTKQKNTIRIWSAKFILRQNGLHLKACLTLAQLHSWSNKRYHFKRSLPLAYIYLDFFKIFFFQRKSPLKSRRKKSKSPCKTLSVRGNTQYILKHCAFKQCHLWNLCLAFNHF